MKVDSVDSSSMESLLEAGNVLSHDRHGIKVVELDDGTIIKVFRRKKRVSFGNIYPYALRMARNAAKLKELGIPALEVSRVGHDPDQHKYYVWYRPLEGITLREALKDGHRDQTELIDRFIQFLVRLHRQGVYFRSIHFGNVIVCPDGGFGLIDFADMSISRLPLLMWKRVRNFKHFLKYAEDLLSLSKYGEKQISYRYIELSYGVIRGFLFRCFVKKHLSVLS